LSYQRQIVFFAIACTFRFESNFSALFPHPLSSELGRQPAGLEAGLPLPLGQLAAAMFGMLCQAGNGDLDYSAIIWMIEGD
jgi:hypothetical protein